MKNKLVYMILMGIIDELDHLEDDYLKDVPDRIERVTYTLWKPKPGHENDVFIIDDEHKEFYIEETDYIPMPDIQSFIEKLKKRAKVLIDE